MLVLSRKIGQKIVIGEDIEIVVIDIRGEHVRLGITAPHDVSVHRYELWEKIAAESREEDVSVDDLPIDPKILLKD